MGTSESYAAQRTLEWASEFKTMEEKLKKSVVKQLYYEYHEIKGNRGAFVEVAVRQQGMYKGNHERSLSMCICSAGMSFRCLRFKFLYLSGHRMRFIDSKAPLDATFSRNFHALSVGYPARAFRAPDPGGVIMSCIG